MILRPLDSAPQKEHTAQAGRPENRFTPAWQIVEQTQRVTYVACWMITQPSHAALAGEIAAKLALPGVPRLEADLVRAIALHDAGWGMPDAQAVMRSRASQSEIPRSFIQCSPGEFVASWRQSVDIAETTSPAGGYLVSRHFWRLAEQRLASSEDSTEDRTKAARAQIKDFLDDELERQKLLMARQKRSLEELDRLTDVLQFCDLLSLFICCGAQEAAEFPEFCGTKVRLQVEGTNYRCRPDLLTAPSQFSLAALRHPATKQISGQEIIISLG